MKTYTQKHGVEFWACPIKEVAKFTTMQTTACASVGEAEKLENKFYEIGWPARAVAYLETVETVVLTSNKG